MKVDISTDMLEKVKREKFDLSQGLSTYLNSCRKLCKIIYYTIFKQLYSWLGSHSDLIMVSN
jgi:hypothetical protein